MTADYDGALSFVLTAEGGYSDDPDDPGGATNLGIEQSEYDAWKQKMGEPTKSVKLITVGEASAIYKSNYWTPVHGDFVARPLALTLFDSAVNIGCSAALKMLQISLSIGETGEFDSATSTAYHDCVGSGRSMLVLAFAILDRRDTYYRQLVKDQPSRGKFLDGWLRRVDRLRIEVAKP